VCPQASHVQLVHELVQDVAQGRRKTCLSRREGVSTQAVSPEELNDILRKIEVLPQNQRNILLKDLRALDF